MEHVDENVSVRKSVSVLLLGELGNQLLFLQHDGAPCQFDACWEKSFGPQISWLLDWWFVLGWGVAWPPRCLDLAHHDAFGGHLKSPISETLWKQEDLVAS